MERATVSTLHRPPGGSPCRRRLAAKFDLQRGVSWCCPLFLIPPSRGYKKVRCERGLRAELQKKSHDLGLEERMIETCLAEIAVPPWGLALQLSACQCSSQFRITMSVQHQRENLSLSHQVWTKTRPDRWPVACPRICSKQVFRNLSGSKENAAMVTAGTQGPGWA